MINISPVEELAPMTLFGSKKRPVSAIVPEQPPRVSQADLGDATTLMDRWDASAGQNDEMYSCAELIAQRGGFKGSQAALKEVMDGKSSEDVTQRPWRWWNEACRQAHAFEDDALAGRIFLFTHLFVTQIVDNLGALDIMQIGLCRPNEHTYKSIGAIASGSLSRMPPEFLILNTSTGRVDVASALLMAKKVAST